MFGVPPLGAFRETSKQNVDETAPVHLVCAQREQLLELVGDKEDPLARVARETGAEHIGKLDRSVVQLRGELLDLLELIQDALIAVQRHEGAREREEWILDLLGADAEVAETPATVGIEARRQPGEHHRRFAAARRAD
jgi:hypothetical protein